MSSEPILRSLEFIAKVMILFIFLISLIGFAAWFAAWCDRKEFGTRSSVSDKLDK